MLIGHDTEFRDTMSMPRRQTMPFEPASYTAAQAAHAASEIDDDSEFGALEGIVKGRVWIMAPWIVLGLAALAAMFVWG